MKKIKYPLVGFPFSESDMSSGRKILSTKKIITMSKVTRDFEKKFAKVFANDWSNYAEEMQFQVSMH